MNKPKSLLKNLTVIFILGAGILFQYFSIKTPVLYFFLLIILLFLLIMFFLFEKYFEEIIKFEAKEKTPRKETFLLGIILLVGIISRFYKINVFPPPIHVDEAIFGNNVLELINHNFSNLFSFAHFYYPNLGYLLPAVLAKLFGGTYITMRIYTALFGTLTIIPLYFLGKTLFNKKIALISSFLFAVSHYSIAYSRIAIHIIETPFWETWSFLFLVVGLRKKSNFYIILSALTCAFGFYHYFASRIVPVLTVIFFVIYFLSIERKSLTIKLFIVWTLCFTVFLAPFIIGFSKNTQFGRESEIFLPLNVKHFLDSHKVNNFLDLLNIQTRNSFSLYTIGGDSSNHYGGLAPRLDIITATFFIIGFAFSLTKIKNYQFAFLPIWFILTVFMGNVLTDTPPISTRVIGTLPVLMILSAIGLNFLLENLKRWQRRSLLVTIIIIIPYLNIKTYLAYPPYYPWIEPKSSIAFYINSKRANYHFYIFNNPDVYASEQIIRFLTAGLNLKIKDISLSSLGDQNKYRKTFFIIPATTKNALQIIQLLKMSFPDGNTDIVYGQLDVWGKEEQLFTGYRVD